MSQPDHGMNVTVKEDGDGNKRLLLDGSEMDAGLLARSATLRGLLDLDGDAPLPILAQDFSMWSQFGTSKTYNAKGLATIIEVAAFLDDQDACQVAATRLAVILRKAYRKDLSIQPRDASGRLESIDFPPSLPTELGSSLKRAVASLPSLTPRAVIALLPHLTFGEALVLPAPFPALALEHYTAANNGILDLSPPRVPAHSPRALQSLCELLSPLLQASPPLTALHIPAPCLHSLDTITALSSSLSTITRLCITHGKMDYESLASPASLRLSVVSALLNQLSPSSLRHLSIAGPLKASSSDPDITRRLSSFTALTSLRMPVPQNQHSTFLSQLLSTSTLSSLSSLSITHAQPSTTVPDACAPVPSLTRLHACGSIKAVAQVATVLTAALAATESSPLRELQLVCRSGERSAQHDAAFTALSDAFGRLPHAEKIVVSGAPCPVTSIRKLAAVGVLQDAPTVQPEEAPKLQAFWQGTPSAVSHVRRAGALMATPTVRAVTLVPSAVAGELADVLKGIVRSALVTPAQLHTLCVLRDTEVLPHSAVARSRAEDAGVRRGAGGAGWVTSRRLGVAHPICALEMLHEEGTGEGDGEAPAAEAVAGGASAGGPPGLRTLRVAAADFDQLVQPAIQSGKARIEALTDLSIVQQPVDGFYMAPKLLGVPHLTALRTLTLGSVNSVCKTAEALFPLTRLTALSLEGSEDNRDLLGELGSYIMAFRSLQRLEVDLQYDSSLANMPPGEWDPLYEDEEEIEPLSEGELEEISGEFWGGMRAALVELPLQLGASISYYVITMDEIEHGF